MPHPAADRLQARIAAHIAVAWVGLLAGCANPGPPRPPSLHLPPPAEHFTAARTGDTVQLRWQTPSESTDGEPLSGLHGGTPLRAELCRQTERSACQPLPPPAVVPGQPAAAEDRLPAELATGPVRLLTYRLTLRNAAGHAAPDVAESYSAAGAAPAAVGALTGESRAGGAALHWAPVRALSGEAVVLTRTVLTPSVTPNVTLNEGPASAKGSGKAPPAPVRLAVPAAAGADAGGALDALAAPRAVYRYTVQRERTVTLAGRTVLLRGEPAEITVDRRRDLFPPARPAGLIVVAAPPAAAGTNPAVSPAMSLSWQPNTEADLAGYFVYRAEEGSSGAPVRLNAQPTQQLSWDDGTALPGHRYRYSVSAVNLSGLESSRSEPAAAPSDAP